MSEPELSPENRAELDRIQRACAMRAQMERMGFPFTLNGYSEHSRVVIELAGESIAGVSVEPDQTITGKLIDPQQAKLLVDGADVRKELIGWEIGLAAVGRVGTPVGVEKVVNMRACMIAGAPALYYFETDIAADNYGCPFNEDYRHFFASYRSVTVGDQYLFGEFSA